MAPKLNRQRRFYSRLAIGGVGGAQSELKTAEINGKRTLFLNCLFDYSACTKK